MSEGERTRDGLGARRGDAGLGARAVHFAADPANSVGSLRIIELDAHD